MAPLKATEKVAERGRHLPRVFSGGGGFLHHWLPLPPLGCVSELVMVSAWESSVFHKPGSGDGRQRDVFPLPTIKVLDLVRGDVCRSVQQRVAKRREKTIRVNKAILALNSFFFGGPQRYTAAEVDDVSLLPSVQKEAISLIRSRVSELGVPEPAWRSEALKVLRASAPSAYSEPEVDTGSTVPMKLDSLSLPSGTVAGVDLVGSLSGHVKEMVEHFEDYLLADASSWNALSDVSSGMEPYNDPLLSTRTGYLQFLSRLYDSGVLSFSGSCRGRVGAFCVAKKPKVINGEIIRRQRLVLDCRQTNLIFKTPPQTRLGSLSALAEAELPPDKVLYAAGADIKDCFYAVNMEPGLQEFFGLKWDISDAEVSHITKGDMCGLGGMNVPVIKVLPMGFSWSFFLVQHLHTQIGLGSLGKDEKCLFLEGHPPPSFENDNVCIMPYCDNIHSLCTSKDGCQRAKDAMVAGLSSIGFQLHEHVEACTVFDTLGGVIDGEKGYIKPTRKRMWHLIYAFECAAWSVVSTKTIQRLLGHSMVVCVLNRSGMSVFRKLYDFIASGCSPRKLHPSERDECLQFAGLVPLLLSDIRKEWSNIITCTDASPTGFGICEKVSNIETVRKHGRWIERWRFKRLPASQWKPRERSEGWDVLSDVRTVAGGLVDKDELEEYVADDDFPEIPDILMEPSEWRTVKMGKWEHTREHITLKEARALLIAVRRFSRSSSQREKRHLCLLDNLALCFAVAKGRAHSFDLLRVLQRISAICLACGIVLRPRWVRSEVNVADAPSRGFIQPGSGSTSKSESSSQWPFSKENFESCTAQQIIDDKNFENATKERGAEECQQEVCPSFDGQFQGQGVVFNEIPSLSPSHKTGGRSGRKQGSVRKVNRVGVEKCEQRDPGSIRGLLSSVRGLLEGERPCLASENRRGRQNFSRLHGCVVPRQEGSCRRGENTGRLGVFSDRVEDVPSSQQTCFKGLAQVHAGTKQASNSKDSDVWHVDANDASGKKGYGFDGDSSIRPLPKTWRRTVIDGSQHCAANSSGRIPVSSGHSHCERFRGGCSRQGRSVRHVIEIGQSKDCLGRGVSAEKSQGGQLKGRSDFQFHYGGIQKRIHSSGKDFGGRPFAPLSTSPRRSVTRSLQWLQGPPRSQKQGSLGDRSEREEVCKNRQGPAVTVKAPFKQFELLHVGGSQFRKGISGGPPPKGTLNDSAWEDVFSLSSRPRQFCLEIFAGTARITSALRKVGLQAFPIDTCIFDSHNVLLRDVEHTIHHWLRSGRVQMVWLGMPCTTFSRARKHDGIGPGPLRTVQHIWGLPSLSDSDRYKLRQGNKLFLFTLRIMDICMACNIPFVVENPFSSMAWEVPHMKRFIDRHQCRECNLDFCMYGEEWKKPTKLVYKFLNLDSLALRCNSTTNICSRTSLPHVPLKGLANDGKFMTLVAQPYPWALAVAFASVLSMALRG